MQKLRTLVHKWFVLIKLIYCISEKADVEYIKQTPRSFVVPAYDMAPHMLFDG